MGNVLNACDYANASNISIPAMKKAGIIAVQRYLFDGGKGITANERKELLAAGIAIVYGYEGYSSNWRGGAHQGAIDGAEASRLAAELGVPKGTTIHYAIDEDAAGMGALPTAKAYVVTAGTKDYPSSAYGSDKVLDYLKRYGFQTYAWSGGRISKYAALYQWLNGQAAFGGEVDYGTVLLKDKLSAEWPKSVPNKPDNSEGDIDMKAIMALFRAIFIGGTKFATKAQHEAHPALVREVNGPGVFTILRNLRNKDAALEKRIAALEKKVK